MPLKILVNSPVLSFLLKVVREEARCSSTGSPFHRDGTTTEKAWFLVDVFLAALGVATCKTMA